MKKLLLVLLCFCMTFTVHAFDDEVYQFSYDELDITIQFSEDTHFSEAERKIVADLLVYGNNEPTESSTYAWCWLTGHDYQYDYVSATHHRILEKAPRCEEITYEVETCSKCDHLEYTEISSMYINCCPEE